MVQLPIKNQNGIATKKTESENPEATLQHVDIVTAINYYGITELLDIIGEAELKAHLDLKCSMPCLKANISTPC